MALTLISGISLGIWVYLLCARGGFWRMKVPEPVVLKGKAPVVTAVVPARNEAAVVGLALASLAAQEYRGELRIVLVDDSSEDGTGEVAREAAPGAQVVKAGPLPEGWRGKMWAVSQGVGLSAASGEAQSEYLLLTDADIVHPADSVAGLVARAREGQYDLVSYMVRLRCGSFAEQALIPAFVFFFFLLYPPEWIRDAGKGTPKLVASHF